MNASFSLHSEGLPKWHNVYSATINYNEMLLYPNVIVLPQVIGYYTEVVLNPNGAISKTKN